MSTVISHGVPVVKGLVVASSFVKSFSVKHGANSYFGGSWEELEALTMKHFADNEPGFGSVDNDVVLVNVPAENFYTSITSITPENEHLVEERVTERQEGEELVVLKVISGVKPPAKFVQIVCYRADTLAQDNDRSSDAEWEIVSVNAQDEKYVPMHPTTMLRNANHEQGGTYREYSEQEWADAYAYWATHAYVEEV